MKTIRINREATINANGTLNSKHCKPVICIDTGEVFTSCTDAAEHAGVHFSMISANCLGKVKTCKGKRYCYLSQAPEHLNSIVGRLREAHNDADDARKWREYQAELERQRKEEERRLEAERKEREKHEAAVEKARAKVERLTKICERIETQLMNAESNLVNAKKELNNLLGNPEEEVTV